MSRSSMLLRRPRPGRPRLRPGGRSAALLATVVALVALAPGLPAVAQEEPSGSPGAPVASAAPPGSPSPVPVSADIRPEGSWVATAYDTWGDGLVRPRPGSTLTVSLLPAGRLKGRTGCGSYLGGHSVEGEAIRLGVLTSETGGCGRRLGDEAFAFTQALSVVSRWAPSETGLDLLDAEGRVRVRLERPGAVSPLGEWVVRRYARADGSFTAIDDGPEAGEARLVLTADGSATGSTGCRDFAGTFTVEAERIVIARLTMVGLPCEGAAQRQDRRLRALLDDALGWRRWADTLVLTGAADEVLLELQDRPLVEPSASPSPAASGAPGDPGAPGDSPAPSAEPVG